jgi:hypothetical protein
MALSLVMAPLSLVMAPLSLVMAPFRWSWPPLLVMALFCCPRFLCVFALFFARAISLYMFQICKNMFSIYFWGLKKFARRKKFK